MITVKGRQYTFTAFMIAASSFFYYELWLPIVWLPARFLFGNFIGYRNNLGPLLGVALRRIGGKRVERWSPEAQFLIENGYLPLPRSAVYANVESDRLLKTIVASCERYMAGFDSILTRVGGRILNIYRPLERIPELRFLMTDQIDAIIRQYYGSSYRIKSVQVWRNQHVPHTDPDREAGIANAFHNDGFPRRDLRLFVLLNDGVTRDTGSLRFHDKAATRRLARALGFFSRRFKTKGVKRRLSDPRSLKFFEGNIGDACLINTQECLHAAGMPKVGAYRDVVQFEIGPCDDAVSKEHIFDGMPEDSQVNPRTLPFRSPSAVTGS